MNSNQTPVNSVIRIPVGAGRLRHISAFQEPGVHVIPPHIARFRLGVNFLLEPVNPLTSGMKLTAIPTMQED